VSPSGFMLMFQAQGARVPPNTKVELRLCFSLSGHQHTIPSTHDRGICSMTYIQHIPWVWQSASYFYFGYFLGHLKDKEVFLLQQG